MQEERRPRGGWRISSLAEGTERKWKRNRIGMERKRTEKTRYKIFGKTQIFLKKIEIYMKIIDLWKRHSDSNKTQYRIFKCQKRIWGWKNRTLNWTYQKQSRDNRFVQMNLKNESGDDCSVELYNPSYFIVTGVSETLWKTIINEQSTMLRCVSYNEDP